jgi:sulfatase modifying factor 1
MMKNYAFIPGGKIEIVPNPSDQDFIHPDLNGDREPVVEVKPFYICKYEVQNYEYGEFLYAIGRKKDTAMPAWYNLSCVGDTALYQKMKPDAGVWDKPVKNGTYISTNQVMKEYYLQHPAYRNYPALGLSYEQAKAFCEFATEAYNKSPLKKFKTVLFRLPTRSEWEYAASGGYSLQKFPWKDKKLTDAKGKQKANFKLIEQENIAHMQYKYISLWGDERINEVLTCVNNPGSDLLVKPVKSYKAGFFGLYNMAGNVEEMVQEKGYTKGGSWNDTGYYLQNEITETYDSTDLVSLERGFRMVMEIVEK